MNLDSQASVRLNVRNKSAISNDHTNQQTAALYQIANNPAANNYLNPNSLRVQNSLTKTFLDYNLNNQQQIFQLTNTNFSNHHRINSASRLGSSINGNSHLTHYNNHNTNVKIIHDSNKFLEDILAHSKRNIKSNIVANSNATSISVGNSVQLPANMTIINRSSEERAIFPDKLIMERRNLTMCPVIEGEDSLKLINYQHNQIKQIQNLDQMRNLIFLDLYDNRIERIQGLSNLINLRVLMLGKNRIQKIENLNNLIYLDILDLHANQVHSKV